MSYSESEVKIVNRLTKIFDGIEIDFFLPKDVNDIIYVSTSLVIDIVYLKKEIKLENKIQKNGNMIKLFIDVFPLEKEKESDLMNVGTLNFIFKNAKNESIMEKKLIVQIFREKNFIFKNII